MCASFLPRFLGLILYVKSRQAISLQTTVVLWTALWQNLSRIISNIFLAFFLAKTWLLAKLQTFNEEL